MIHHPLRFWYTPLLAMLLGASAAVHSKSLSSPWFFDPAPVRGLGEAFAATCHDGDDTTCLSVVCRDGSLYLEFNAFGTGPDDRSFGVDLRIDDERFLIQLKRRDMPSNYGTWHADTPIDADGDLIQALLHGRTATLSSNAFYRIDFSLNRSSAAIEKVERHCDGIPTMSHSPKAKADQWDTDRLVAEATGGRFTRAQGQITDDCGERARYSTELMDLNGDGQPEVFVSLEGTCSAGNTGTWMDLYIKDRRGRWQSQFGFPGIYRIRKTTHGGFPDIEIGGPGFCFPVWRWNGQRYRIHERCN